MGRVARIRYLIQRNLSRLERREKVTRYEFTWIMPLVELKKNKQRHEGKASKGSRVATPYKISPSFPGRVARSAM